LSLVTVVSAQTFVPSPGNFPAKGDGDFAGGIFSVSLQDLPKYAGSNDPGGPDTPKQTDPLTTGSGPYPAQGFVDSSLPGHTIFAPKAPPSGNLSLPFIAWGNGACMLDSSQYQNFLVEIASHGYVIAADGVPGGVGGGPNGAPAQSKVQDMRDSLDWAFRGGANKYGNIDLTKVATAGHSCGGLEAMSTAYHDARVKRILMFNIAIFQDERRYLLQEIKVPVAYFIGGPTDMGYTNSAKDYALLNAGLQSLRGNILTGHGGTFIAKNGGKQGKAAVAYLEWQFRDDKKSKAIILDPTSPNSLVKDNWTIEHKNWGPVKRRCERKR